MFVWGFFQTEDARYADAKDVTLKKS